MRTAKRRLIVSALCVGVFFILFLLFPLVRPQGIPLKRQATISKEADGTQLIKVSAFVYRGVYFSPDGPNMARWYYETIRLKGKGEEGYLGGRRGHYFQAGNDFDCVGTKFYNSGTLFLDDAAEYMSVRISKEWGYASASAAYVNGHYDLR